jgi:hypothetical protein
MINCSVRFTEAETADRMVVLGIVTGPGNRFPIFLIITHFCLADEINLGQMDFK